MEYRTDHITGSATVFVPASEQYTAYVFYQDPITNTGKMLADYSWSPTYNGGHLRHTYYDVLGWAPNLFGNTTDYALS